MKRITRASLEVAAKAANAVSSLEGDLIRKAVYLSAFNMVQNRQDWKGPIDASIDADLCEVSEEVISDAVVFFTATVPTITHENGKLIVKAIGYRKGPAGDH